MRYFVLAVSFLMILLISGCSSDTSGYVAELTSDSWSAELEGGGVVSLSFDGGFACLDLHSNNLNQQINGRFIADDSSFVIFMPEISQNYSFDYVTKGNSLELSYNNYTITLNCQ